MYCITRVVSLSKRSAVRSTFQSALSFTSNSSARQISILTTHKFTKKSSKNITRKLGAPFGIFFQNRSYSQEESSKNSKSDQTNSDEKANNSNGYESKNFEDEFKRQQEEIRKLKEELETIYRRRQRYQAQRRKVWLVLIVFFAAANVLLYLVSTSVPEKQTGGNAPVVHNLDRALLERLDGKWMEMGANNIKTKEEVAISMLEFDLKRSEPNFIQSQKSSRSGTELSRAQSHLLITSSGAASKTDVLTNNNDVPELATKITAVTQQNKEFVLSGNELIFNGKKYIKTQ